jgi:acetyl esterase/lipase
MLEPAQEQGKEVCSYADQVYSYAGGAARMADVFVPSRGDAPFPVVIWLHGGGWRFGDRHLAPDLARFAQRSGLAVVSIDYRLSDEVKFPAPVEDVKTAVRWVRSVASRFGFDGRNMGLWGSSAGAHLAACAALSSENEFLSEEHPGLSSAAQAVVDGYGPTNLGRIDEHRSSVRLVGNDAETVLVGGILPAGDPDSFESRLIGAPLSKAPRLVELADPVHYVRSGSPPFLILHGQADTLIPADQSRYIFEALRDAGCDATLVLFQNLKHGFFNNPNLAHEDIGAVSIYRSSILARAWSCDPTENIPSMVSSFFQAHLDCALPRQSLSRYVLTRRILTGRKPELVRIIRISRHS